MKAKEYAEMFSSCGKTDQVLFEVWKGMFFEFKEIANKRHAQTDSATLAIFRELDKKWRAFARIAGNGIREDGFVKMTEHRCPDLYEEIKKYSGGEYK